MGYTFSYSDLASDLGTQTANGLRNAANQAANTICDVYKSSPAWLIGQILPGNPGQAFAASLMSGLCAPRSKIPDINNQGFEGGQCSSLYNFSTGRLNYTNVGEPDPNGENVRNFTNIQGPLKGFRYPATSFVFNGTTYPQYGVAFDFTGGFLDLGGPSYRKPPQTRIFNIVRVGGADNCGNPVPVQPTSVNPPASALTINNNFLNTGSVFINAPITVIPTLIQANANFRPVFNVKVGPFNVKFDVGGVQVTPSFSPNVNISFPNGSDPRPSPPAPYDPNTDKTLPSEGQPDPCDLTEVKAKLDDIKDCSCPVNYSVNTVALGSGIAGYSALPSNSIKVNLTITQSPSNAKTQKSYGSEPENYFCGYYYWGDGTGRTERIAVSTLQSVFYKPDWASAFGWNLYLGYNCSVTASYLQPDKAGSQIATLQMKKAPS
jgi:hypothetical protein